MNLFSNNVPAYRLPTIEQIIDFSVDYIYNSLDKNKTKQDIISEGENALILSFFLPKIIPETRNLFQPFYQHLLDNYASKPLPSKQQFKQEILEKYSKHLQSNLQKLSKYL